MVKEFPVYRVDPSPWSFDDADSDSEGRFFKFWCEHPELGRVLFKEAASDKLLIHQRRFDWSEKVAAELGKLLGLPIAQNELAIAFSPEKQEYVEGTVSVDYRFSEERVISGRQFLSLVDPDFDRIPASSGDPYNIPNILHHLQENAVGLPQNWLPPTGIETGADLMVGYLLFDCWISATDRHDENWEIALVEEGYILCPTYDHGDSLGVKLSGESIVSQNFQDPGLIESCWWASQEINGRMQAVEISNQQAFATAAALRPMAASIWFEKLQQVRSPDIIKILAQIPTKRINNAFRQFTIALLDFNSGELQSKL
jgi:hypothetical protein